MWKISLFASRMTKKSEASGTGRSGHRKKSQAHMFDACRVRNSRHVPVGPRRRHPRICATQEGQEAHQAMDQVRRSQSRERFHSHRRQNRGNHLRRFCRLLHEALPASAPSPRRRDYPYFDPPNRRARRVGGFFRLVQTNSSGLRVRYLSAALATRRPPIRPGFTAPRLRARAT
jgi:hypothetical protein